MNQDLGLKILSQIMEWSDERAREEFRWLRLMSRLKYDGYHDFQAGMRFIESLATWLQQFKKHERETAYGFIRNKLVYIGPSEMQRLVEQFYPKTVHNRLIRTVAADRSIPPYRVYADDAARGDVDRLRRQTLFMGLSDGARIDAIRHVNSGVLTNEQFVAMTQIDMGKWQDLLRNLRDGPPDNKALFRLVYLIDDFSGTGSSFLRYDEDKSKWLGKLIRFHDSVRDMMKKIEGNTIFSPEWELCIHHYIATSEARQAIEGREREMRNCFNTDGWAKRTHVSFGTVLPENLPIKANSNHHDEFIQLAKNYYDSSLETKHTMVSGVESVVLGYGNCALPLVLDHNTPNNSVALLWAETDGVARNGVRAPAMRPLFRRRQRHG